MRPRLVENRVLVYKTSPQYRRGRAGYISVFKDQSGCQGRFRPFAQGFKGPRATITPLGNRKDTRLVPSRQCLFHSQKSLSLLAMCVYSFHIVTGLSLSHRKESNMKTYRKHHQPAFKRRYVNKMPDGKGDHPEELGSE